MWLVRNLPISVTFVMLTLTLASIVTSGGNTRAKSPSYQKYKKICFATGRRTEQLLWDLLISVRIVTLTRSHLAWRGDDRRGWLGSWKVAVIEWPLDLYVNSLLATNSEGRKRHDGMRLRVHFVHSLPTWRETTPEEEGHAPPYQSAAPVSRDNRAASDRSAASNLNCSLFQATLQEFSMQICSFMQGRMCKRIWQ